MGEDFMEYMTPRDLIKGNYVPQWIEQHDSEVNESWAALSGLRHVIDRMRGVLRRQDSSEKAE